MGISASIRTILKDPYTVELLLAKGAEIGNDHLEENEFLDGDTHGRNSPDTQVSEAEHEKIFAPKEADQIAQNTVINQMEDANNQAFPNWFVLSQNIPNIQYFNQQNPN